MMCSRASTMLRTPTAASTPGHLNFVPYGVAFVDDWWINVRFYIWDAPCPAAVGVGDSIEIAANTASFGVVGPLNRDVDKKVEQNGGLYRGSQVAFTVAREAGITIVTAGAGNVVAERSGRRLFGNYSRSRQGGNNSGNSARGRPNGPRCGRNWKSHFKRRRVRGFGYPRAPPFRVALGQFRCAKGVAASMKKKSPNGGKARRHLLYRRNTRYYPRYQRID